MRLFTALDLPPEIRSRIQRLVTALRPEADINWSPQENLHITTKFIGEWPEKRLDEMDKALCELRDRAPFEVSVNDLGWFPNAISPRVLWAEIGGGEQLGQLAEDTSARLAVVGVLQEAKPYRPHVTLARMKSTVPLQALRMRVEEMGPAEMGAFLASSFHLFSSEPGTNASLYRKLREYRFEKKT